MCKCCQRPWINKKASTYDDIHIDKIAKSVNYKVYKVSSAKNLASIFKKIKKIKGPILILVKIKKDNYISKRILLKPKQIKHRFMSSL